MSTRMLAQGTISLAESLASLPDAQRIKILRSLTDKQAAELKWNWEGFWARPNQKAPRGNWLTWVILTGRGWGKTRVASEMVRAWACGGSPLARGKFGRIALVAETAADARDILVEGESGILAVHPPEFRPNYEPSKRRLTWANGAQATTYNATEPDQLRGPQHEAAVCDELAKWSYARETWDQLQFGLRLGDRPQQVITTTPRPIPILKEIMALPGTVVTRGRTAENRGNLAPSFLAQITERYAGTRLGRQELEAEILDDNPNALWRRDMIEAVRVKEMPRDITRCVVAIDPSGTKGNDDDASDVGIVVAGKASDGLAYVLADRTCNLSPAAWGRRAVEAYHQFGCDRLVAERNFGGAMVAHVIRTTDPKVSYKEVVASRGKWVRAEPVAALYEQKRVKHVGAFPQLEDEMCLVGDTLVETIDGQKLIRDIRCGDAIVTRNGPAPVAWAGQTGTASEIIEITSATSRLEATACHPVFVRDKFVPAKNVRHSDRLLVSPRWAEMERQSPGAADGIIANEVAISATQKGNRFTVQSMRSTLEQFRLAVTSIIGTETQAIIDWLILNVSRHPNTTPNILLAGGMPIQNSIMFRLAARCGQIANPVSSNASYAGKKEIQRDWGHDCFARSVASLRHITRANVPVYNLRVADGFLPEFFANGVLVHNCSFGPDGLADERSPNRLDALVWAITELMLAAEPPRAVVRSY